ncbi:MAG: hypothetical protein PHE06_02720 [Lachnospiraceae bacterium]|nr:hypothetical protein [Lachnospiraceae bacterium]
MKAVSFVFSIRLKRSFGRGRQVRKEIEEQQIQNNVVFENADYVIREIMNSSFRYFRILSEPVDAEGSRARIKIIYSTKD